MAEYIERNSVHEMVKKLEKFQMFTYDRSHSILGVNPDDLDFKIDKIPAADVAPVRHGKWILVDKSYGEYECSVCHARDSNCSDYYGTHNVTDQDYCPCCGAKMDLKDEA